MKKNEFNRKIIIGSANFGLRYGADPIQIKKKEINKIIKLSKNNKIYKIDTADGYIQNKNYFKNIDKKFKFITKMVPDNKWASLDYCQKNIENHFEKLNGNKIETLLFHDVNILFSKNGPKIFKNIKSLKKKYFKKIGISIYDTKCLQYLTSNYELDVVQCPFNILDKRIIYSGWVDKLKKKGIEIQVRSIFLQGLLVNKKIYKKKYFRKWKKTFTEWFKILENNQISPVDYCLTDLLNYDFDQIVIGVNNCDNLKEILNFKTKENNFFLNIKQNDLKLVDPRNWK